MSEDSEDSDFEFPLLATFDSETAIGMKGSDGFVLAAEKITTEPLLDTTQNRNISTIEGRIGVVVAGLTADARRIINEARTMANDYRNTHGLPTPPKHIMQAISAYMHENTLRTDRRPLAASLILGEYPPSGPPQLYCIEPSGAVEAYNGWAIGKAAYAARSEMEEIDFPNTSIAELVKEAAKIIYMVQDDQDDFALELSWCGAITNGIHVVVPPDVLAAAVDYAKYQNSGTSDSDNI